LHLCKVSIHLDKVLLELVEAVLDGLEALCHPPLELFFFGEEALNLKLKKKLQFFHEIFLIKKVLLERTYVVFVDRHLFF
jgi:hypothetical protein